MPHHPRRFRPRIPRVRAGPAGTAGRHAPGALLAAAALWTLVGLLPATARGRGDLESQLREVAGVELRGRHSVPAREIHAVLKTRRPSLLPWAERAPLRYDFLTADRATIQLVYRQHGFLDARVRDSVVQARDPGRARVLFLIQEGRRSYISSVEIAEVHSVPAEALRRALFARPGRPFNPAYLIADTAVIARQCGERGYLPHVVGAARRDTTDSLLVHVTYLVDEGPLYHVGDTRLAPPGLARVRERLVRRELLLRPGGIYRGSRVEESQERLYETGLFSEVQIEAQPDSTGTVMAFLLHVRERKPRWLDAGVGSGSAERFRFVGEWGHRNLTGVGLQGLAGARLALDKNARFLLSRGEVALLEPWLFRTRNRAQLTVYAERRRDFRIDTLEIDKEARGVTVQIRHDFGRLTHLRLTQDNTWVVSQKAIFLRHDLSDSTIRVLLEDFLPSYSTHRLQLGGERDRRDHPFTTSRGSVQVGSAELAGGPFKGSTSFTKFETRSCWYTPLRRPGWVLATRARAGLVKPFGERKDFIPAASVDREVARVPTEDLFRLGGVNSVRGYDENEIAPSGGLALLTGSVELRVPVAGPFGLEVYLDAGNVWARPEYILGADFTPRLGRAQLDPGDVRYVYGVGGRFNLAFAPLRLDLTWGSEPKHRAGRYQFAIGPAF